MFGFSLKAWIYVALAVALMFGFYKAYAIGQDVSTAKWQKKYDELVFQIQQQTAMEIGRQAEANRQAQAAQQEIIEALRQQNAELNVILEQNLEESSSDPNSNLNGISAEAARRLNRI